MKIFGNLQYKFKTIPPIKFYTQQEQEQEQDEGQII